MGDEETTRKSAPGKAPAKEYTAEAKMADILYWARMHERLRRASEALDRERRIFNVLAGARTERKRTRRRRGEGLGRPRKVTPAMEQKIDELLDAGKHNIAATVLADLPKRDPNNPALDTLRDHVQQRRRFKNQANRQFKGRVNRRTRKRAK